MDGTDQHASKKCHALSTIPFVSTMVNARILVTVFVRKGSMDIFAKIEMLVSVNSAPMVLLNAHFQKMAGTAPVQNVLIRSLLIQVQYCLRLFFSAINFESMKSRFTFYLLNLWFIVFMCPGFACGSLATVVKGAVCCTSVGGAPEVSWLWLPRQLDRLCRRPAHLSTTSSSAAAKSISYSFFSLSHNQFTEKRDFYCL